MCLFKTAILNSLLRVFFLILLSKTVTAWFQGPGVAAKAWPETVWLPRMQWSAAVRAASVILHIHPGWAGSSEWIMHLHPPWRLLSSRSSVLWVNSLSQKCPPLHCPETSPSSSLQLSPLLFPSACSLLESLHHLCLWLETALHHMKYASVVDSQPQSMWHRVPNSSESSEWVLKETVQIQPKSENLWAFWTREQVLGALFVLLF